MSGDDDAMTHSEVEIMDFSMLTDVQASENFPDKRLCLDSRKGEILFRFSQSSESLWLPWRGEKISISLSGIWSHFCLATSINPLISNVMFTPPNISVGLCSFDHKSSFFKIVVTQAQVGEQFSAINLQPILDLGRRNLLWLRLFHKVEINWAIKSVEVKLVYFRKNFNFQIVVARLETWRFVIWSP